MKISRSYRARVIYGETSQNQHSKFGLTASAEFICIVAKVMMRLWQQKLECVLPDQPGLILLPEFCDHYDDRPPQFNQEPSGTARSCQAKCGKRNN